MNVIAIQCSNCKSQIKFDADKLNPEKALVRCPICKQINEVKPEQLAPKKPVVETPEDKTLVNPNGEVGWLIVHDEQTQEQTFGLKQGKNIIGRASSSKPADVAIVTTDTYMSRNHCVIEVKPNQAGILQYIIYDIGSTNGTFINGNKQSRLQPDMQVILKDGDTIQLGRTKVVLKTIQQHKSAAAARNTILMDSYQPTIIV
jgi:predicted Zn finger-like uncharacterized protein